MHNDEKVKIIKAIFMNEYGTVDLGYLDFGDTNVMLNHMKTKGKISNMAQEAETIYNTHQKAKCSIVNEKQKAPKIIT